MYKLINHYIAIFTQNINLEQHFHDYKELKRLHISANIAENEDYQGKYAQYWGMNGAGLNQSFRHQYFILLQRIRNNNQLSLTEIVDTLYNYPINDEGTQKIQFSFATKLLHTVDNTTPIYDSFINAFYFFPPINNNNNYEFRKNQYMNLYSFLKKEYKRILDNDLLLPSMTLMKSRFQINELTDYKIIDSIIWSFVKYLKQGGIENGNILYQ